MNHLKLCLVLALSLPFAQAQKLTTPDDGGLRTLGEDPEPGPPRVTRIETLLTQGDFARLAQAHGFSRAVNTILALRLEPLR